MSVIRRIESIDYRKGSWLLQNYRTINLDSDRDLGKWEEKYDPTNQIVSYLELSLSKLHGKPGELKVKYNYAKDRRTGRLYPAKGLGFISMARIYRNFLTEDLYYDLDIVNAQPTILMQYAKKHEIETPFLNEYVSDRENILKNIVDSGVCSSVDEAKIIVISYIFGGGNSPYYDKAKKSDWLIKYSAEMSSIITAISTLKENEEILSRIVLKGKKGNSIHGGVVSIILQDIEASIIKYVDKILTDNGFSVAAFMHDGLLVRKEKKDLEIMIPLLEEYIENNLGWKIKFKIKPIYSDIKVPDDYVPPLPLGPKMQMNDSCEEITVMNDIEAGDYMIEQLNGRLIACTGRYFFKEKNIWIEDNPSLKLYKLHQFIDREISKRYIVELRGEKKLVLSKTVSGISRIGKAIITRLEKDDTFIKNLWNSNIGTITFDNGVFDMEERKFYEGGKDGVESTISTGRNYNPSTPEARAYVRKVFFDKIFWKTPEITDYLLHNFARGLAGKLDKAWNIITGPRDSGKSLMLNILRAAFGDYIGSFSADSWILQKNNMSGEEARAWAWIEPLEFTRLNFSSELKPNTTLDGNIIKKVASGGDGILSRVIYKDTRVVVPQGKFTLLLNDIGEIKPDDARETSSVFDIKTKFVDEITEENERVNNGDEFRYYVKDINLKNDLLKPENLDALIDLIFEQYGPIRKSPVITQEDTTEFKDEDNLSSILSQIEFTDNRSDKVDIKDIKEIFPKTFTARKRKEILVSHGAIYNGKHGCFYGIKMKIEKEEETCII